MKISREDKTSTNNKRLFARILEIKFWLSGIIQRLIPTKSLRTIEQDLWLDINIPTSTKQVTLAHATREASTSARIRVSC